MFRRFSHAIIFTVIFVLMGAVTYAGYGYMKKSERLITSIPDQAVLVFIRNYSFGSSNASVFDVRGRKPNSLEYYMIRKSTKRGKPVGFEQCEWSVDETLIFRVFS